MTHRLLLALATMVSLAGCREALEPSASEQVSPAGHAYVLDIVPDADRIGIDLAWQTDWFALDGANPTVPSIGADLMLSGGAGTVAPGEIAETFADMGAEGYLWTTADAVRGALIVPSDDLERAVDIANAVLTEPGLDETWLDRIADGQGANVADAMSQPGQQGSNALRYAILRDTPIRAYQSVEDAATFAAVTREDVAAWHERTFVTEGLRAVISGPLDAEAAGAALDRLLDGLPAGEVHPAPAVILDTTPRRILLYRPQAKISTLTFMAQLPPTSDPKEVDDVVAAIALGGDENSILFDAVRTRLRASYGFGAGIENFTRDARVLTMTGEVETAKLGQAADVVAEAYDAFRRNGDPGRVEALAAQLADNLRARSTDPATRSTALMETILGGYPLGRYAVLAGEISRRTNATVTARMQAVLPEAAGMLVVAVSPDADALPGACVIEEPRDALTCP